MRRAEYWNPRQRLLLNAIAERDRPAAAEHTRSRETEDVLLRRGLIVREGGVLSLTDAGREIAAARRPRR
jgi:hypothetical protein